MLTYGGPILETNEVPEPPSRSGITLTEEQRAASKYTIRIGPSNFPRSNLIADAEAAGLGGARTASPDQVVHPLAAAPSAAVP